MSLSLSFYKQMMSSDWFNPPECTPRPFEPKESLQETVGGLGVNIFMSDYRPHTRADRALRYLMRTVALIAIGVLAAPAGMLEHGLCVTYHLYHYLKSGKNPVEWEKVVKHARWFFADLWVCAGIGIPWYRVCFVKDCSRLFYLAVPLTLVMALSVQVAVTVFAQKNERVPLFKISNLPQRFWYR